MALRPQPATPRVASLPRRRGRVGRGLRLARYVLAVLLLAAAPAFAADPDFPPLTGRVVDQANLLSPGARDKIIGWLAAFEQESGGKQVVVATVKSLDGLAIEDYGYRLGRFWGIGQKDKNTGAILLVAPTERKVRIEVGYGLEGELTDALSKAIIEQDILPSFRTGNFEEGIVNGTLGVLRALGWKGGGASAYVPPLEHPSKSSSFPIFPVIFIFIMFAFFIARLFRAANRYHGGGIGMNMLGYALGSALGSSGSSGGGFSGGFSGGGGSFGGGGASGSW